jgi:transketolase C-terminal domain/subunit
MWRLSGCDSLDRPPRVIVDPSALDLAEMKIVDGCDPAQQLSVGTRQSSDLVTADVMRCVRLEVGEANRRRDRRRLMGDDQIIRDGGDVHVVEGSGCVLAVPF